jgi:hypothetical protein
LRLLFGSGDAERELALELLDDEDDEDDDEDDEDEGGEEAFFLDLPISPCSSRRGRATRSLLP